MSEHVKRAGILKSSITFCIAVACVCPAILAGSGRVRNDGTIDCTVNLRFPATETVLQRIREEMVFASHVLWDASEGQLRFGQVTITCGRTDEDLADMWVAPNTGRHFVATSACDGSLITQAGRHIQLYLASADEADVAHEFGHLALGLSDEYDEQRRFGACWGYGRCIELAAITQRNHCLMELGGPAGSWATEFCTLEGHDLLRGDGQSCEENPVPHGCDDLCEPYSHATDRYETTQETYYCESDGCWPHLVQNFPFLEAPGGLPVASEPGGFVEPQFTDLCDAADSILLVLDTSGSMRHSVKDDIAEVCDNGIDDDDDGETDEDGEGECAQSRISYLQAACREFIDLSYGSHTRVGIVSFNSRPTREAPFQDVTWNRTDLLSITDGLTAIGGTAIGIALLEAVEVFEAETDAGSRSALLVSDGLNTVGVDPADVVDDVRAAGIRLHTLATGEAADDDTLSDLSGSAGGAHIDMRDPRALVGAFARLWAERRGNAAIIPLLPYEIDSDAGATEAPGRGDHSAEDWIQGRRIERKPVPSNNVFRVEVEEGSETLTAILAGANDDMAGFGVVAEFSGPPGPNPRVFHTESPDPLLRIERDGFFVLAQIHDPNPGTWYIDVRGRSGAARRQVGNLTVLLEDRRVSFFARLDRTLVEDTSDPLELTVIPRFDTPIHGAESIRATLIGPEGSISEIPISDGAPGETVYRGRIEGLTLEGPYEVRVWMRTGTSASNHPGEPIFADRGPSNSVKVPDFECAASRFFRVARGAGKQPCPGGSTEDCDGDGITGESERGDADGDGLPDAHDRDSDGDEIPDSAEWRGQPTDLDRDGKPDHLDPDADGDGLRDDVDPDVSLDPLDAAISVDGTDLEPGCSGPRTIHVRATTSSQVVGWQVALVWSPEDSLEVLSVAPGPDVPEKSIKTFESSLEGGPPLPAGRVLASAELADAIGPGRDLRILTLLVRARPTARLGTVVTLCPDDNVGGPSGDTRLTVLTPGGTASISPKQRCGDLVLVGDRTPPAIETPGDLLVSCPGPNGVGVDYEVVVTDGCGDASLECTPAAGSIFPPGSTTVLCRAEDKEKNVSFSTFQVYVGDVTAPRMECPADIAVAADSDSGARVEFVPRVTDDCGVASRACDPPSGSVFPVGATTVLCTAEDASGNRSACRFTVTVQQGGGDPEFLRGDCDGNGEVGGSVTDAVILFLYNFLGGPEPPCLAACDANADGDVVGQVTDGVFILQFNFLGGPPPPSPFPDCGPSDLPSDADLGCRDPQACPR